MARTDASTQELDRTPGIYVLLVEIRRPVTVGRLGTIFLDGRYAYVGSAQGPGGLGARLRRHARIASGHNPTRHWHVDPVLAWGELRAVWVWATSDPDAECRTARKLQAWAEPAAEGFGASDCGCRTHLVRLASPSSLEDALDGRFRPLPTAALYASMKSRRQA